MVSTRNFCIEIKDMAAAVVVYNTPKRSIDIKRSGPLIFIHYGCLVKKKSERLLNAYHYYKQVFNINYKKKNIIFKTLISVLVFFFFA